MGLEFAADCPGFVEVAKAFVDKNETIKNIEKRLQEKR
jgi:hypothetical protein